MLELNLKEILLIEKSLKNNLTPKENNITLNNFNYMKARKIRGLTHCCHMTDLHTKKIRNLNLKGILMWFYEINSITDYIFTL